MAVTFTDEEINALIKESKPLPADWQGRTQLQPKRGHNERRLDLTGENEGARYQERGMREDTYAEATDRYSNFSGAWGCLVSDANLVVPPDAQLDLFAQEVE